MRTAHAPAAPPRRDGLTSGGVALFDLDGTITRRDTYLAYLLGYLARHPRRLLRAAPLPAALAWHFAGQRDNTWLKCTFLRSILGGEDVRTLEGWTERFLDGVMGRGLRPRALEAIGAHRAAGDHLVLATASLHFYAEPLAGRLGMDAVICTGAAVDGGGRLTGELDGENCYGANKLKRVEAYLRTCAADQPVTFYTDHHADLPLLRHVQRPVAVNPTRQLRQAAASLGIPIEDWDVRPGTTAHPSSLTTA